MNWYAAALFYGACGIPVFLALTETGTQRQDALWQSVFWPVTILDTLCMARVRRARRKEKP